MLYYLIILVQGFCPLKIKITQFPDGFRLNGYLHQLKIMQLNCIHSVNTNFTEKRS